MCFVIHPEYPNILVAEKDIVCYKRFNSYLSSIGERKLLSPYKGFNYELGETYYEDSFEELAKIELLDNLFQESINIGLHSYSRKATARIIAKYSRREIVIKCIIPEGAKYMYDPRNCEYVSDYITIGNESDIIKL